MQGKLSDVAPLQTDSKQAEAMAIKNLHLASARCLVSDRIRGKSRTRRANQRMVWATMPISALLTNPPAPGLPSRACSGKPANPVGPRSTRIALDVQSQREVL